MNTLPTAPPPLAETALAHELIEGLARVVAVDDTRAWLVTEPPAACSSCATRGACASGSSQAKTQARWCVPRTPGPGQIPWALGDLLQVGVDRNALLRASLTAYALPLGFTLTAVVALQSAGDALAILGALTGLALGVAAARLLTRRWRHALSPVVLGRAPTTPGNTCTPINQAPPPTTMRGPAFVGAQPSGRMTPAAPTAIAQGAGLLHGEPGQRVFHDHNDALPASRVLRPVPLPVVANRRP